MKTFPLFSRLVAASLLIAGSLAEANSVPKLINYQGKLVQANGTDPLAAGTYVLRFELFDAPTAGTLVWGESQQVAVVNGIFNVLLGGGEILNPAPPVTDLTFAFGSANRFLRTTIVSGPGISVEQPLSPRQQLASVPYAMTAHAVVPVGGVIMWWGSKTALPAGFEICDGTVASTPGAALTSPKPDLLDKFVKGSAASDAGVADLGSGGSHVISGRTSGATFLDISQIPRHSHVYDDRFWLTFENEGNNSFGRKIYAGSGAAGARGPSGNNAGKTHYWAESVRTADEGGGGSHSHAIPSHDNRPSFQEMYFIIRVL